MKKLRITPKTKQISFQNGLQISISHYSVNGDIKEFHARAYKDGQFISETYCQYRNGYNGLYSCVACSVREALDNVEKWVLDLAK